METLLKNAEKATEKKQETPAVVRPWGGGTADLKRIKTFDTALRKAGLDFEVRHTPLVTHLPGDDKFDGQIIPNRMAVQRCDTGRILETTSKSYQIVQYKDAFKFFENFVDKSDAVFDSAGVLRNGGAGWISMKLPNYIEVKGDESRTDLYVVAVNSHDRSYPLALMVTPIRVWCSNTLRLALRSKRGSNDGIVRIKHTKNAKERMEEAPRVLGLTNKYWQGLEKMLNDLNKKQPTKSQVQAFEKVVFPINTQDGESTEARDEKLAEFKNFLESAKGQDGIKKKGTAYWYLNGYTRFLAEKVEDDFDRFDKVMKRYQTKRDNVVAALLN